MKRKRTILLFILQLLSAKSIAIPYASPKNASKIPHSQIIQSPGHINIKIDLAKNDSQEEDKSKEDQSTSVFNVFLGVLGGLFILSILAIFIIGIRRSILQSKYQEKVRQAKFNLKRGFLVCFEDHDIVHQMSSISQLRENPKNRNIRKIKCNICNTSWQVNDDFYTCKELCRFVLCNPCYNHFKVLRNQRMMHENSNGTYYQDATTLEHKNLILGDKEGNETIQMNPMNLSINRLQNRQVISSQSSQANIINPSERYARVDSQMNLPPQSSRNSSRIGS